MKRFLAIAFVLLLAAWPALAQKRGDNLSSRAGRALELCFDGVGTFLCTGGGGGISGSGSVGTMPVFTAATTVGNSSVTDNGTNIATTATNMPGTFIVSTAGASQTARAIWGELGALTFEGFSADLFEGRISGDFIPFTADRRFDLPDIDGRFILDAADSVSQTIFGPLIMPQGPLASPPLQLTGTFANMTGSQTANVLRFSNQTSGTYSGAGNVANWLSTPNLAAHPNLTANFINLGTGFETFLEAQGDGNMNIAGDSTVDVGGELILQTQGGDITIDGSNGVGIESQSQDIDIISAGAMTLEVATGSAVNVSGGVFRPETFTAASLPVVGQPAIAFCSDCNTDSTCTSGGGGAYAFRFGATWVCELN